VLRSFSALICFGIAAIGAPSCGAPATSTPDSETMVAREAEESASGCQPHVEVHGSAFWASELGRSEMWVQQNHRLNLWERPGATRGAKTGELLVGSRALILEETSDGYRVRSPLDGATGWVSAVQVARKLSQDVTTREPC
jgi:hypothetical protein